MERFSLHGEKNTTLRTEKSYGVVQKTTPF
jgi:hypothetical protein